MKSQPNFERRNRNLCALQLINVECYNFLFNEVIDSLLGGTFQKRPFFLNGTMYIFVIFRYW